MDDWGRELDLAFRLADAADSTALRSFRSEEVLTTHKVDGTPVSQIDFDVEEAMLAIVRAEHPDDAVIGEEIGSYAGASGRRWIFDGIDGTHNYALGRPGWGTAIALEVGGEVVVGLVSCPRYGRRCWATRGGGAWQAPFRRGWRRSIATRRCRLRCCDGDVARDGGGGRDAMGRVSRSDGATSCPTASRSRNRRAVRASCSTPSRLRAVRSMLRS